MQLIVKSRISVGDDPADHLLFRWKPKVQRLLEKVKVCFRVLVLSFILWNDCQEYASRLQPSVEVQEPVVTAVTETNTCARKIKLLIWIANCPSATTTEPPLFENPEYDVFYPSRRMTKTKGHLDQHGILPFFRSNLTSLTLPWKVSTRDANGGYSSQWEVLNQLPSLPKISVKATAEDRRRLCLSSVRQMSFHPHFFPSPLPGEESRRKSRSSQEPHVACCMNPPPARWFFYWDAIPAPLQHGYSFTNTFWMLWQDLEHLLPITPDVLNRFRDLCKQQGEQYQGAPTTCWSLYLRLMVRCLMGGSADPVDPDKKRRRWWSHPEQTPGGSPEENWVVENRRSRRTTRWTGCRNQLRSSNQDYKTRNQKVVLLVCFLFRKFYGLLRLHGIDI